MITRFLPFVLFKGTRSNKSYISYLGQVLPYSAIGLLVVYCLKSVNFKSPSHGIPEAIAIICIIVLHYWKENTLLSIGVGTVIYMVLVQTVFI
jgi:branched-subunit amino acid transport protein AzlD